MALYTDKLIEKIKEREMDKLHGYFDYCVSHNNNGRTYFPYIKLDNSIAAKLLDMVEEAGWEIHPRIKHNIQAGEHF